ncbi:glycoside hydrolase family 6 protein [Streptomyces sp. G-G2]|uniref:glycoside hydrolase family 6 protein n=1 Tax=Streptomyces sp. G-G2 TaxID=3046201 RepID=UPI0024B9A33A|nr:glycoside hydrolase family 6 protein [Streptomyces sp. G-G2]MDJ0383685.1 glycoside hydrolase family 6 protein [Streptomyces sp. G-G2]
MRHRHLARTGLLVAVLAALSAPASATPLAVTPGAAVPVPAPAPDSGRALYAPAANPGAVRQAAELAAAGHTGEAAGITAMATTPHAVWLGDQSPDRAEAEARTTTADAARQGALPVLVLYNVPGRDCSQYSAGGAAGTEAYRAWVDAVVRGIDGRRAVVILEPDSLALLPRECPAPGGGGGARHAEEPARTEARYAQIGYAVRALAAGPATEVYLDSGHADWHTVNSIVPRLRRAGIGGATGFAVNVSNYRTDEDSGWFAILVSACLAHTEAGGRAADCPDQWRPRAEAGAWLATHLDAAARARMKHYVTDTSRNGRGAWTAPAGKYRDPQDWCNPPGRGLGARPTTATGAPLQDARLWIKTPGESDGACLRGTAGPVDPERGSADPGAGDWFPQQALELVGLANPAR